MKHTLSAGLLAAAIVGLGFGVAEAHPRLLTTDPAPKAHVAAPTEVRLGYSETLIGKFSRITLMDSRGHAVKVGATVVARDGKQLVAPIRGKLSPGNYMVMWKAVSTDTHRVQGSYAFTVAR